MKIIAQKISARVSAVIALTSVTVLSGILVANLAGAGPATTDTTAVAFVSVPAKTVMSNNSIPAGATESAVVIGGTSTVPSNATTVRLEVTARGTAAGTITLFPAGNAAGGAGHTVSWVAGGTNTEVEAENVGMANKVSVKNSSTKAAVVTLKITGYSTQVTAGDINGSGGTAGQVLTNDGTGGATWEVPGHSFIGSPCAVPPADDPGTVQYTVEKDGTLTFTCERTLSPADDDGDGFSEAAGDCNDTDPSINPDAVETVGDDIDNDCDGVVDDDHDGDGWGISEGDCNDGNTLVYPGAIEFRDDAMDNDCDGEIDEE